MSNLTVRLHRHDIATIATELEKVVNRALEAHRPRSQPSAVNDNQIGAGIRVLTIDEVAELLSRSVRQLYRLEQAGKLPRRRLISLRRIGYLLHEIEGLPAEAVTVLDRRIIRREALAKKLSLHKVTVTQLVKTQELPPPNERGEWLEREIDLWILSRPLA